MDWVTGIQNALDYIEAHILEPLDYEAIAKESFSSSSHFQMVFSTLCGYTLGEYIRNRRLTLAGQEIISGDSKIIDVAAKYGYDSPDSFTKAFQKFHGITPTQARNEKANLRIFTPMRIRISFEGGDIPNQRNFRVEEKSAMLLTGYGKRFTGSPSNRNLQDHYWACENRLYEDILQGISGEHETIYEVLTNFGEDGYDFYYAYQIPLWASEDLDDLGEIAEHFTRLSIPAGTYLICETERCQFPTDRIEALIEQALTKWLPSSGYVLRDAPELGVIHWFWEYGNDELNNSRYCEVWLPIEKSK